MDKLIFKLNSNITLEGSAFYDNATGNFLFSPNGPFTLRQGSIGVGNRQLRGLLTGSSDCFDRLMQRLRRCEARGEPVTLTVR